MDSRVVWGWLVRRHVFEYLLGSAAAALAILVRWLIDPYVINRVPFGTCLFAVVVVAWFGGFRAAITALLIGLVAAIYLFVPPRGHFWPPDAEFRVAACMYLFIGFSVAFFSESQRRTQSRLELKAVEARNKQIELEREIAEHKQTQERLIASERHKDEFLAVLAHELRSPLAPIVNSLELLRVASEERDKQWACQVMDRQVSQMNRLINDLLDVSRISEGKIKLQLERVELASIVELAVETVEPFIRAQGHELTVSLPDRSILLHADAARLAQVLSNLLNNAAKYMEQGGRIWLSAKTGLQSVDLCVRDEGIGIAPEELERVFNLFTQSNRALERSQGGLGIGLTLARAIVELHGGSVTARSAGLGCGSEFVVCLPGVLSTEARYVPAPHSDATHAAAARQSP